MGSIESYYAKGPLTDKGQRRKTDMRYSVRFRKPDNSQGRKRGFSTKSGALAFLASIEVAKNTGTYIDAADSRVTVAAVGKTWLDSRTHLKPSSYRPIEIAWRIHVEPKWGAVQVGNVRHSQVQTWVSELSNGRSATTVLRAYGVLASILDAAVKDRRIPSNSARGISLPRKQKKARRYLTHEQVQALSANSRSHSTLVLFLAYTGLRWGEATGLRLHNLDMVRRRINVQENAVNVGGKVIVGTPKSHEARSVPFPGFLAEPLAALCEGKRHDQLVFGDGVAHLRPPDRRRGWFISAIAKCQKTDERFPTLTLHDLRHTAASLAVSAGANVKAVQRMLGHASAAMTLDVYADLFEDDLDEVAAALDQARSKTIVPKSCPIDDSEN
ncbi:MAG: tyrosine-type recombinase/integrase [Microbacteriaceae bacterium]